MVEAEDANSQPALVNYVMRHVCPGAIILMHNGREVTIASIKQLVFGLRARGYRLVTLNQMVGGR